MHNGDASGCGVQPVSPAPMCRFCDRAAVSARVVPELPPDFPPIKIYHPESDLMCEDCHWQISPALSLLTQIAEGKKHPEIVYRNPSGNDANSILQRVNQQLLPDKATATKDQMQAAIDDCRCTMVAASTVEQYFWIRSAIDLLDKDAMNAAELCDQIISLWLECAHQESEARLMNGPWIDLVWEDLSDTQADEAQQDLSHVLKLCSTCLMIDSQDVEAYVCRAKAWRVLLYPALWQADLLNAQAVSAVLLANGEMTAAQVLDVDNACKEAARELKGLDDWERWPKKCIEKKSVQRLVQRTAEGIKHTVGWPEPLNQAGTADQATVLKACWKAIAKPCSHWDWIARPGGELSWPNKASFAAWFASKGPNLIVHTFPSKVGVELLFDSSVPAAKDGSRAKTCFEQPIGDSDSDRDLSHFSNPVFASRPPGWIEAGQPWEQVHADARKYIHTTLCQSGCPAEIFGHIQTVRLHVNGTISTNADHISCGRNANHRKHLKSLELRADELWDLCGGDVLNAYPGLAAKPNLPDSMRVKLVYLYHTTALGMLNTWSVLKPEVLDLNDICCAFRWLLKLDLEGHKLCPRTYVLLGECYMFGCALVRVDLEKAEQFLCRVISGEHNHAYCTELDDHSSRLPCVDGCILHGKEQADAIHEAVSRLTEIYTGGLSWPAQPDRLKAVLKAVAQKCKNSCGSACEFNLGLSYRLGSLWPKNFTRARKYYERAIHDEENANPDAMIELAVFSVRGHGGLEIDFERAEQLIARARTLGWACPQRYLMCDGLEKEMEFKRAGREFKDITKEWDPARPLRQCERSQCRNRELTDNEYNKCGKCADIIYCSKRCQADDWARHRVACRKPNAKDIIDK